MTGLLKRASSKGAYPMFEAQNKGPCCYIDGSPRKTGGSRAHRAQIAARSQFEVMQKVRVSSIYRAKLISILQNLRRYGYVNISVHDRYSVLLHSYAFVLSKPGKSHFPDQIFPPPFGQGRWQTLRTVVLVSSTFFPSFCGSSKTMTKVIRNLDVQGRGLQTCMALYGSMAVRCSKHTIKSLGQRDASGLLPLFTTWWDHRPHSEHYWHYCAMFDFLQFHCDWHSSSLPIHFQSFSADYLSKRIEFLENL